MSLVINECIPRQVANSLSQVLGCSLTQPLKGLSDNDVLSLARKPGEILVTRDKIFAVRASKEAPTLLLRTQPQKPQRLVSLIQLHEAKLKSKIAILQKNRKGLLMLSDEGIQLLYY